MAGLFDVFQGGASPEQDQMATAVAQGLLSANGSQGLGNAMGLLNASKMDILKQRDLAQQIQMRNIALQQQAQEWQLQLPMLKAMADRMNGGGQGAQSPQLSQPSQPAIAPTGGGALGSGTFGIPMGGQDASAAPQRPSGQATGGSTMFPGVPDSIAFPTAAFGGFKAVLPLMSKYNEPTDLMKTMAASGLQPGSPEWNQALQRNVAKTNYIAPINARPGMIGRDPVTNQPLFFNPHIPEGSTPSFDASGNVVGMTQIPGALPAIAGAQQAKTEGVAEGTASVGYDASGKPVYRTKGQDLRAARGLPAQLDGPPMPPATADAQSTPYQRAGSDVASIQREIDGVTRSMAPAATKKMQLDVLNAELAKAQAGAPGVAVAGGVTPQQAPGLVTNADAAQKASAQTMHESYSKLQANGSTANAALDALDKMMKLAADKNALLTAGVLGTNQSAVNPSAAEYEKQRANVISLMSQQLGAGGTDAGRANIAESVPDFGKPKSAIADGLSTLRNQLVAAQMKRDLLTPIYQAGDSKKYTTLENQYDQNVSPALVPLLTMQPGPQRAAALKAASQHPEIKARLNWAAENGLLK